MTTECADVLERLWEFLDAELTTEEIARILRHMAYCVPCRHSAGFDRAFLEALRRQRSRVASAQLVWQVRIAIRATAP